MTNLKAILLFVFAISVSSFASADAFQRQFWSAEEVATKDLRLKRIERSMLQDGYTKQSESLQTIYYFIPPQSTEYKSSIYVATYIKHIGGDYSLETEYVKVTADIIYNQETGLYHAGTVTTESTVVF